ncbi:MAG TPA: hypothetical protein VNV65_02090 [Candidatus Solibacter sp.]|jgi:hypothetical protein|nr:hypothetical protein [Candidatus Solibacter sp.]
MRRLGFLALIVIALAGCQQPSAGGAFSDRPSAVPTAVATPHLDLAALQKLRAQAAAALSAHTSGGVVAVTWGSGGATPLTGPYREDATAADALGLLASRSLAAHPSGGPGDSLAGQATALAASATAASRQIEGAQGAAYLLMAEASPIPASGPSATDSPNPCISPVPGQESPQCLRQHVADGLLAAWYAGDRKMFFHIGDTTTVYRPVEAIAVGAALVVAGYAERDESKIESGSNIISVEMRNDFDPHFGLAYGLVSVTSQGGHSVADSNTHIADQAGIAEALLRAFDASREAQYFVDARTVLQPLLDETIGIRGDTGYVSTFDVRSAGPAEGVPVDVEAAVLTLQAAHHYDRDDGGRFAQLEENAARALLGGAARFDPAAGIPGSLTAQGPSQRSGVVTSLVVQVLGSVVADLSAPASPAS